MADGGDLYFARFAIYAYPSGEISRMVICEVGSVDDQLGEGERWIECNDPEVNDLTHKVIGGEFVPR